MLDISCLCAQSTFIHFRNVNRQNSTNYEKSNILGHIGMPNNVSKCVFAISLHIVRPSHHLVPVDIHCSTSCCVRYILYIFFCADSNIFPLSLAAAAHPQLSIFQLCLVLFSPSSACPGFLTMLHLIVTKSIYFRLFLLSCLKCATRNVCLTFFQQQENLWCGDNRRTFDSFNDFAISMQISVSK